MSIPEKQRIDLYNLSYSLVSSILNGEDCPEFLFKRPRAQICHLFMLAFYRHGIGITPCRDLPWAHCFDLDHKYFTLFYNSSDKSTRVVRLLHA